VTRRITAPGKAFLTAFAAVSVATGLARAIVTTYLPVLLNHVREAPGLIGTVMLVNAAAGFAVPLVVGYVRDRRAARRRAVDRPFMLAGALVTAVGLAAVGVASDSSYLVLAALGAVVYVGINIVTTAYRALIPLLFAPSAQARGTAVQEAAALAGSLVGVAVGGVLSSVHLWLPFVAAAAVTPVLAWITYATVDAPANRAAAAKHNRWPLAYYMGELRRRGVTPMLGAQFMWVLSYGALPVFFILYAKSELGLSPAVASLALAGIGLLSGGAMLAAGRVRSPEACKPLLAFGVVAMGVGFAIVAAASSVAVVAVALVPAAVGFGVVTALGFPLFASLMPSAEEGGYTALFYSSRSLASAVALPAAGWLIDATGSYRALFGLSATAAFAALLPLAFVPGQQLRVPVENAWLRFGAGTVVLFAAILGTGVLVGETPLSAADEWLFRRINQHGPGPDLFWEIVDPNLQPYVLLGVTPFVLTLIARRYGVAAVLAYPVISALLAYVLLVAVATVYDRARPEEILGQTVNLVEGQSWSYLASYPSGHVAVTAALAFAAARLYPFLRIPVWTWTAVVAFSRVLFGSHFPVDTLGAIALGYGTGWLLFDLFSATGMLHAKMPSRTRVLSRIGRKALRSLP
jgi:membrane-associated phospholipid phosphatase